MSFLVCCGNCYLCENLVLRQLWMRRHYVYTHSTLHNQHHTQLTITKSSTPKSNSHRHGAAVNKNGIFCNKPVITAVSRLTFFVTHFNAASWWDKLLGLDVVYAMPPGDMVGGCCVCSDEQGWNENPLVYCDGHGCTVAVHQGTQFFPFFQVP